MTSTFIEVQRRDQFASGPSRISQHELRLMYTMAFVRYTVQLFHTRWLNGSHWFIYFELDLSTVLLIQLRRDNLPCQSVLLPRGYNCLYGSWSLDMLVHTNIYLVYRCYETALVRYVKKRTPFDRILFHITNQLHQALMWLHDFYWMAALKPDGSAPLTKGSLTQIREMLGAYKDARKKQLKGKRISHTGIIQKRNCYWRMLPQNWRLSKASNHENVARLSRG